MSHEMNYDSQYIGTKSQMR